MKEILWKDYIESPYWRRFSKSVLDDKDVCCALCGRPKWAVYKRKTGKHNVGDKRRLIVLTLHHRDYLNLGVGEDNVIPICRGEHTLIHDIERMGSKSDMWKNTYKYICANSSWEYIPSDTLYVPDDFVLKKKRVPRGNKRK